MFGVCSAFFSSSNPQPPSKNDIELKKRGDAEKEAQSGENA